MILFLNCFEAQNTGMRMLANITKNMGFDVHIIVMRDFVEKQNYIDWKTIIKEQKDTRSAVRNSYLLFYNPENYFFSNKELDLLKEKLLELKPEMVCISSRGTNNEVMPSIINTIKNICDIPVICGGFGPTYASKFYLENGADIVLRGEGEISIPALLENHKNKKPLSNTPNAVWLENGILKQNKMAPPLEDFSSNPIPLGGDEFVSYIHDDICEEKDPAFLNMARGAYHVVVGRGCIGTCSYCAAPLLREFYVKEGYQPKKYRRRNYSQVIKELQYAKENGAKKIVFADDYLLDTTENLINFLKEYKKIINLPFRADFLSSQLYRQPELLKAALDAGFSDYTVGFQGGNEYTAKEIYDRPHSFAELKELGDILFKEYITVQYHFISGTTINTEKEFLDKCKLISTLPYDELNPNRALVHDNRFFPQEFSKLTNEIGKSLQQIPIEEWANLALRAQLRHFLEESECQEIEKMAQKDSNPNSFLLKQSSIIRHNLQINKLKQIIEEYKDIGFLIMGECSTAYNMVEHLFKDTKIIAKIGFPNFAHTNSDRIAPEKLKENSPSSIPLLIFGSNAIFHTRIMKSYYGIKNNIYPITYIVNNG